MVAFATIGAINKRASKLRTSGQLQRVTMQMSWRLRAHFTFHKRYSTMAEPLVPLPAVDKLSSRVIRVLGGNPGKVSSSACSVANVKLNDASLPFKVRHNLPFSSRKLI